MSQQPLVTVLMAVHNDAAYVMQAVQSILSQTLTGLEFLVIDDGSTDGSAALLSAIPDPRLRLVKQASNQGLTTSLKAGVALARGQYLARLDADDFAHPDRLSRQVAFLEANPAIGIVGTVCTLIDESGADRGLLGRPLTDLEIRWFMLRDNPFAHPSVMVRRGLLGDSELNYDEGFRTAQDYDLWTRLMRVTRGANLHEPLTTLRLREGISVRRREEQLHNRARIARAAMAVEAPGVLVSLDEADTLCRCLPDRQPYYGPAEKAAHHIRLYFRLFRAFQARHRGDPGLRALGEAVAGQLAESVLTYATGERRWLRCLRRWGLVLRPPPMLPFLFREGPRTTLRRALSP